MWLQQVGNGRVKWGDYKVKMEFRRALVWHSAAHGTKVMQHPSVWGFKKPIKENLGKVMSATPQTQACTSYNEGKCTTPDENPRKLHMCSDCLVMAKRQCAHHERFCRMKTYTSAGQTFEEVGVRQQWLTSK